MKNTKNTIPRFIFHLSDPCSEKYRGIELNGEIIHWIEDTDRFVGIFGFTPDMRDAGISPEEFIRKEYINNRDFDFTACMQTQIIEYLRMHSRKFILNYGSLCEKWLADLARMRETKHAVCTACKITPFCID